MTKYPYKCKFEGCEKTVLSAPVVIGEQALWVKRMLQYEFCMYHGRQTFGDE